MYPNMPIGVGLRYPHYQQVIDERPPIGWFEVHSENFFHQASPALTALQRIRTHYPMSLHGVGLSLGSAVGIASPHLMQLKSLIQKIDPFLISEHLSWSRVGKIYLPDLFPIPYTDESFSVFARNIDYTQHFLQREILIENPSSYLEYSDSQYEEVDFLVRLCQQTGAKILLDVNNVFVSCSNHGWDAKHYLDAIPAHLVKEIHLAGHSVKIIRDDYTIRVDTHDDFVCEAVWTLYAETIKKVGIVPTLLEWDAKIPSLAVLMQEAQKANDYANLTQRVDVNVDA